MRIATLTLEARLLWRCRNQRRAFRKARPHSSTMQDEGGKRG